MRKDGSRFWASGFVRPVLDEEGNLLGFSKVARDLTDRKRVEEAVQEVRWAERERLARDLRDLVLQDLVYALQAGQAYSLARREDEQEGVPPVSLARDGNSVVGCQSPAPVSSYQPERSVTRPNGGFSCHESGALRKVGPTASLAVLCRRSWWRFLSWHSLGGTRRYA